MLTSALLAALLLSVVGIAVLAVLLTRGSGRARARLTAEGFQELEILVKGHYVPDVIELRRGIPARLNFRREENTPCSERVIFSDFHVGTYLPAYKTTLVCFIPTRCGEFLFTCAFGMYQGQLAVVEPSVRELRRAGRSRAAQLEEGRPHLAASSTTSLTFVPGGTGKNEGSELEHDDRSEQVTF